MKVRDAQDRHSLSAANQLTAEFVRFCPGYSVLAKQAAALLGMIVGVTHTMVLHYFPEVDGLLLQEGIGWPLSMLGQFVLEHGANTLAGITLSSGEPVNIYDLQNESRFLIPRFLLEGGLVSGLCIRISSDEAGATGMLAAFSEERREFGQTEIASINAVAGMLSLSMTNLTDAGVWQKDQEQIEQAKQEWEATVDALPHFICLLDEHGHIVRANRSIEFWVNGKVHDVRGRTIHDVLHPDCDDPSCYMLHTFTEASKAVMQNRHLVFEVEDKLLRRKLEIQLRPTARRPSFKTALAFQMVMVMHDITRIKNTEEILKHSNSRLEDMVRERTNELSQTNEQLWCEILERRRVVEELRQSENDMRLLSAQLLTAQEMERKRIAAELHDGISQSLTAIKFSIESAVVQGLLPEASESNSVVDNIISRIQTAIEEVHQISTNLRPSMLDDLGIIPTIAWFCREFDEIYHDICLETFIGITEEEVPASLKTIIYRILQEALNNIVRHAEAKNIVVYLGKQDSTIVFKVKDNGKGFVPASLRHHRQGRQGSGLASMRERTEFSGGTYTIQSVLSTGTTIRAAWPMQGRD